MLNNLTAQVGQSVAASLGADLYVDPIDVILSRDVGILPGAFYDGVDAFFSFIANNLGGIAYAGGELDRARAAEERAVELFLRMDDLRHAAGATWYLGLFAVAQGRWAIAAEHYDQSLRLWLQSDSERVWFKSFAGLADVAAELGLFAHAARLIGATVDMLDMLGAELMPFDKPGYARACDACRSALEPDHFAALVAEGRRMAPEDWLAESSAVVAFASEDGTSDR
jgi:tetratricopeptide (TPR) repeat protein